VRAASFFLAQDSYICYSPLKKLVIDNWMAGEPVIGEPVFFDP
jgi:hypothetical protein